MRSALLLLFLLPLPFSACGPAEPTPKLQEPPRVYDVGWRVLVRDWPTARTYTGHRVRIHLLPGEYEVRGGEVRVSLNDSGSDPVLVFENPDPLPPDDKSPLVVVGTCQGPFRDYKWRGMTVDYYVTVSDCRVTVR